MAANKNKVIKQIIGLGAIAGMRATFAPSIISHYLGKHPNANLAGSKLSFVESPITAVITKVLSTIEVAGDKAPTTGNRTAAPQLLTRIASGAFAGAVLAKANESSLLKGVLLGGTSALIATFASFYIRKYIDTLPHVKDAVTGGAEDLLALGAGVLLMDD